MGNTTERFTIVGDLQLSVNNALGGINQLQDKLSKLKLPQQNQQELTSAYKKLQSEAQNYINIVSKGFKTKQDKKDLERSFGNIRKYINEWNTAFNNIDTKALKSAFDELNGGEIKQLTDSINQLDTQLKSLGKESSSAIKSSFSGIRESIRKNLQDSLKPEEYQSKLTELNKIFSSTATRLAENFGKGRFDLVEGNLEKLKERITELFKDTGVDNSKVAEFLQKISEASHNINEEKMKELVSSMEQFGTKFQGLETKNLEDTKNLVNQLPEAVRKGVQSFGELHDEEKRAADGAIQLNNEVDHLKSRITYFFGLANGVQLFRRALRDAVNTTKELDAVMTQTAVVSKNTVADMWKTLPEYSKEAKKLGAAIKDVYSAQTLYVQQGLEMNQAMELGVETLKMARVAGIDSAEATNSMTAALRGFNMELTETSALRVNDVYSKLAQNTASNVQEISTAMTKTAALANSANMSFENTAAFLATIIESTREGAETAGTALKTVIARFTEVKKLYSEGELTGTDEEGQEVDVNKISKALRTAGINMNEFFTGAKGLDEIFMELGSKWNSLTTVQQRYIATMAAGSRQQSRFLALMQNYSRTAELTEMAYNSAGSSQEQFEKTLDSLEAKLNQFKAAWDNFVMGIANSDFVKGAIDAGTKLLETINKIIDAISGGNGLVKSIASIATAVGVFKAGKGLAGLLIGGTNGRGGLLGPIVGKLFGGKQAGETAAKGFLGSFTNAVKAGTGKNFLSGVLKDNFSLYSKPVSKIDTSQFQVDLMDTTSNIDFDQYKDSLYNWQDSVAKFGANSNEADVALKTLEKDFKAAGGSGEEFSEILQNNSTELSGFKVNMNGVANVAGIVGAALMGLGSIMESWGGNWKKAGQIVKAFGIGLLAFTGIYKVVTMATKAFGIEMSTTIYNIPIVGWIAAVISALITLGSVMATLIETPREAAERISAANEKIQQGTEQVKQSYEDLKTAVNNISKQEDVFDDLIFGTQEWDNAVQNLNQSILELIKLYPELAAAVKYTEEGRLYLDTESQEYKDYIESKRKASENASIASESSNLENTLADLKGKASPTFWQGVFGDEDVIYKKQAVFEQGLSQYLKSQNNNLTNEVLTDLEKAINDNLIYDAESFRQYLFNNVKNDSQRNALLYYYPVANEFIQGQQLRRDYFNAYDNLSQGAFTAINQAGYNTSSYSNMYKNIALKDLGQVIWSYTDEEIKKLRNQYKKEYAEAAGIKENEVDNDLLDSYIREQLAIKDVFKDNEFLNYFNTLVPELKTIASKIISGEEKTLTKTELGQVNQLDQTKLSPYTQIDLSKYEENYLDELTGTLTGDNKQKVIDFSDTLGQIENYTKNVEDIISRGGDVNKYFELLDQVINSIADPKKREEAKQLLSTTAAIDADAIRGTALELQKLGAQIDSSLTNQIINATNAVAKFNLKNFEEQVKALEGAKKTTKDISEGKKIVSVEDYNNLKEVFGTNFDESKWTLGLDGYTYIGEETNSLLTNIDKAVGILVQNSIDQTKQDIEIGEHIQSVAETKIGANFINGQWGREEYTLSEYISMMENNGNVSKETTEKIAALMGKDLSEYNFDDEDSFKAAQKALVDYYNDYYAGGVALEANYTKRDQQEAYQNMPFWGKSGDYTRQMGGSDAEQISAYIHEATETGLDLNVLDQYTKQLEETYELSRGMAMAIAYDNMLMNKGIEELASNYEEWNKALEAGEGTGAYEEALIGLNEALKKITGTTQDFSREFLSSTENAKMFKKAAEGDAEAINQLRKASAKDILKGFKLDNKVINELTSLIDNLDLNVEVGTELKSDYANVFQGLLDAGILTAEQVNQALETIGYEPNVQYQEMTLGAAKSAHQTAYLKSPDGGMTKVESDMQLDDSTIVQVPIIGGSSASQGTNIKPPTYKGPTSSTITQPKKSGGGGGGGGEKEFKNDFDKYYNMVEDINELERLRNLLETDYNQLLNSEYQTGKQIYDNLKQQIALLRERRDITADLAEKRKQQIIDAVAENSDLQKYAWWNNEDLTIEINWDLINSVKDSEEGDRIKEYVSILEDFQSKYDEQIEALEDIESTIQEIEKRGRDQYTSLEDRVRDALIKRIQDQIDELTASNEGINTANQNLLDSIQQTLSKQRQERENAKTEEELSDKEKRLEYLRQDSSGANALEIAQLEKELAEARENYTDQLIDQKISELQEQNDAAAEQRQEQIDLLQQSLDWQEKNGEFWEQAYAIMYAGIGPDGSLVKGSELEQLLKSADTWNGLSDEGKMNWLSELEKMVAEATGYLALTRQLEDIGTKAGSTITFTNAEGQTLTGVVDKNGNVVVTNADGSKTTYKDVYQDYSGNYRTNETSKDAKTEQKPATSTGNGTGTSSSSGGSGNGDDKTTNNNGKGWEVKPGKNNLEWIAENSGKGTLTEAQAKKIAEQKNAERLWDAVYNGRVWEAVLTTYGKLVFKKAVQKANDLNASGMTPYKTGGLNTQTGPAWLDGTPSRPELVLNARDTENFIQLKDTLQDLRKASSTQNLGGDNYYDIDINVDKIDDDYDVDRLADRLKQLIYKDGQYRNVNVLNRLR